MPVEYLLRGSAASISRRLPDDVQAFVQRKQRWGREVERDR